jgi:hypothetical protein
LEIWVTNKQNRVVATNNNLRNIIALQDLGEAQLSGLADNEVVVLDPIPASPPFFYGGWIPATIKTMLITLS